MKDTFEKTLGTGNFGTVKLATHNATGVPPLSTFEFAPPVFHTIACGLEEHQYRLLARTSPPLSFPTA